MQQTVSGPPLSIICCTSTTLLPPAMHILPRATAEYYEALWQQTGAATDL